MNKILKFGVPLIELAEAGFDLNQPFMSELIIKVTGNIIKFTQATDIFCNKISRSYKIEDLIEK